MAWTTPATWASGNVPTAAQLNTGVRDNMLHLYETIGTLGYARTFDPRFRQISMVRADAPVSLYMKAAGAGAASKLRIRVITAAGNVAVGVYTGQGAGQSLDWSAGMLPDQAKMLSGSVVMPAAGTADITLPEPGFVDLGDWFAIAFNGTASAIAYHGLTGSTAIAIGYGLAHATNGEYPLPISASINASNGGNFAMVAVP